VSRARALFRPHWVDGAGLGCAALYAGLASLARSPGGPGVASFLLISAAIAALTFGLYAWSGKAPGRISVGRLLFWAVVFRAIGVFGGPFFEDDYFRYLWDGYRFAQDGTPYGIAPEAFFADPAVPALFQGILDQINFPELPTIYGPVTQLAFLLGYGAAPGSVAALQVIFILFDLFTIGALLRLAPPRAVLLYAWCPLVVKEVAFTAHPDGLAVFLVIAAVLLAKRERFHAAAALLAFGAAAKVLALVLAPFVLRPFRWTHWAAFGGVLAVVYLPFAWQGGSDLPTLFVFARDWEFNAAVFALLTPLLPNAAARVICGALFLAAAAWIYVRERDAAGNVPPGDRLYGLLLLLAPVVNPWYLLWVLPFAAIRPSPWAWTASVAVLLSYATGLNLQDMSLHPFGHPPWVPVVEYGAVGLAAAAGIAFGRRRESPRERTRCIGD
jgi:hypothetical protein